MGFGLGFTGYCIGQCWVLCQRMYPEYRQHCRRPYAEIGYRAGGPLVKWTVVASTVATASAVVLIVFGSLRDYDTCAAHKSMPDFKVTNYFLAFATLTFAYAGHSSFPTLQHDMKKPKEFAKSNALGFAIVVGMYLPVCLVGYLTYGDSLRDSIINSIQTKWIQQTINVTITLHLILSLTTVFNPLNQEIEEYFKIPQEFGIKRVIIRLSVMVAIVFVGESVPSFGPVMDLVGGAIEPFTSIVFPVVFYAFLRTKEILKKEHKNLGMEKDWDGVPSISQVFKLCPRWLLIAMFIIMAVAFIGAGAATYSAILELSTAQFQQPCYIAPFLKNTKHPNDDGHTNCCGQWQNISRYNDISKCSKQDFSYYS
uniref:Amino acid transporter transmembrane domain-containing protein n=1 Tax=Panagrolaimus sp. PS1159 TaxID=55785 RepID=A0AC35GQV9_9BILA